MYRTQVLAALLCAAAMPVAWGAAAPDPDGLVVAEREVLATEDACVAAEVGRAEEWKFLALQMAGRPQQE